MSVVRASVVSTPVGLGLATFGDRFGPVVFGVISTLVLLAAAREASLKLTSGRDHEGRHSGRVR